MSEFGKPQRPPKKSRASDGHFPGFRRETSGRFLFWKGTVKIFGTLWGHLKVGTCHFRGSPGSGICGIFCGLRSVQFFRHCSEWHLVQFYFAKHRVLTWQLFWHRGHGVEMRNYSIRPSLKLRLKFTGQFASLQNPFCCIWGSDKCLSRNWMTKSKDSSFAMSTNVWVAYGWQLNVQRWYDTSMIRYEETSSVS